MKIYLASPYTGTPEQQKERYIQVCRIAGDIWRMNHNPFSPIAHSHGIAVYGGIAGDHETWQRHNMDFLLWCDEVWVAMMDGWEQSKGIEWEIEMAEKMGKRVRWHEP